IVPEEKREHFLKVCKEARACGRAEQEEIIKNSPPQKDPWYSPVVVFVEGIVDTAIAAEAYSHQGMIEKSVAGVQAAFDSFQEGGSVLEVAQSAVKGVIEKHKAQIDEA